jgi:D-alanyl-D-alanine carboxypeptidase
MKKQYTKILIFFFIASSFFGNAYAGGFDTAYARILQNRLNYLKTAYNLVGISAAVEVPGQGKWFGTAGISDSNNVIDTAMIFDIGSITKNFMSALILQLAEEDSLGLEDSIGTWLPQYNNINNKITIRQLLQHTSGLYNFTDNPSFSSAINANLERYWQLEEVVSGYVLAPYFTPGASWHYSNTNFVLLAMIATKIMNTDLNVLFRERFFTPLNMNESFVQVLDSLTSPMAHNWIGSGTLYDGSYLSRIAFSTSSFGAGGVVSRPENLLKWGKALYTGQVLNQNSLTQMLSFVNANIAGGNGYGLGTIRFSPGGRTCWGHAGNAFGYSTSYMYYPVDSICMSIMMNRDINTGPIAIDFMNTVLNNNPIGVTSYTNEVPRKYMLQQNYPNPFNPETKIRFSLPAEGFVKLTVYDVLGKEVKVLVNRELKPGAYETDWNASGNPSGIYFYKLESKGFTQTKKMILVK